MKSGQGWPSELPWLLGLYGAMSTPGLCDFADLIRSLTPDYSTSCLGLPAHPTFFQTSLWHCFSSVSPPGGSTSPFSSPITSDEEYLSPPEEFPEPGETWPRAPSGWGHPSSSRRFLSLSGNVSKPGGVHVSGGWGGVAELGLGQRALWGVLLDLAACPLVTQACGSSFPHNTHP